MKKAFLLLALLATTLSFSQSHITLSVYQDAKFGMYNLLLRTELQDKQGEWGYFYVAPEFEYAQIKHGYYRYSVNAGYTFNKLIVQKAEAGASIGYGIISRNQRAYRGFNGNAFLKYPITSKLKFCLLAQVVDRKDIVKIQASGFVGIEINLN
jgi:hypothetical protein